MFESSSKVGNTGNTDQTKAISEIAKAAQKATENLIPQKSEKLYKLAYNKFTNWCSERNVMDYSEDVLLAYFLHLSVNMKMKSSTLWSQYSMLRTMISIKDGADLTKYLKLRAYLKQQNKGYNPKKAEVFTKIQFEEFLENAPDEQYLAIKTVFLFGVAGACRCDELVNMRVEDVEDLGSLIHVKIPFNKTEKPRSFTIVGERNINIYRKYVNLRPKDLKENRLFVKFQNGKCYKSVMGVHKIGSVAQEVALFLKLPNWKLFTGHSLRRTSATIFVDSGGDISGLKRLGGWKSTSCAEGYIADSITNKKETAAKILFVGTSSSRVLHSESSASNVSATSVHLSCDSGSSVASNGTHFQNLNNCTFNFYFGSK